jgi:hypothetical protein
MRSLLIYLVFPILGIACSTVKKDSNAGALQSQNQAPIANVQDKIQGQWISETDNTYEVIFSGSTKTDFSAGQLVDEAPFLIENGNVITLDPDLTDSSKLFIVSVTDSTLHLNYIGANTELYFRKKADNS